MKKTEGQIYYTSYQIHTFNKNFKTQKSNSNIMLFLLRWSISTDNDTLGENKVPLLIQSFSQQF